jgi:hypothetical protein
MKGLLWMWLLVAQVEPEAAVTGDAAPEPAATEAAPTEAVTGDDAAETTVSWEDWKAALVGDVVLEGTLTGGPVFEGEGDINDTWLAGEDPDELHYLASLEVSGLGLLPRLVGGAAEGYTQVHPGLILDGGERFGLYVHLPLRLHVAGGGTAGGGGPFRERDWDSRSDLGQWLRELRVGRRTWPVRLKAGALEEYSLMAGHLVGRYSNRFNPDYHPAGAVLTGQVGPLHAEAFTSDVLAARLVGGELALNLASLFGEASAPAGWCALSVSAAHDFGRAEGRTPEVGLAHADLDVALVFRDDFQVFIDVGAGMRPGLDGAWGALVGAGLELYSETLEVHAQVEARRQRGGFRQGFFGPDYELGRFAAAGPAALPVAEVRFPDGYSAYGELSLGHDTLHLDHARREFQVSVAAEVFSWGRVDVQARVATWRKFRQLYLGLDALAVGVGQPGARYAVSGEVRYRFSRRLYVLGRAGTLLFPQPEGTVRPGMQALLGLGADYGR